MFITLFIGLIIDDLRPHGDEDTGRVSEKA